MQVTPEEDGVTPTRPCDLILDANTAIVLDCGTQIFLWLGSNLALPGDPAVAVRRESLRALAAASGDAAAAAEEDGDLLTRAVHVAHACAVGRVPVPELRACLEGTGDERYVLSRLAPTTTDEEGDIQAQLPHLAAAHAQNASYTEQMIAHIVRRLPRSDDPSLVAWAAQAGVDIRPALHGMDVDGGSASPTAAAGAGGIAQARQAAEKLSGARAAAAAQGQFRLVAPKAERNPFGRRRRRSSVGGTAVAAVDAPAEAPAAPPAALESRSTARSGAQSPVSGHVATLPASTTAGDAHTHEHAAVPDLHGQQASMHAPAPSMPPPTGHYTPQPMSDARAGSTFRPGQNGGAPPVAQMHGAGSVPGMPGRPSSARPVTGPPPLQHVRTRPGSAGGGGPGSGIVRPPLVPGPPWVRGQNAAEGGRDGQRPVAPPPVPPGIQTIQRARS